VRVLLPLPFPSSPPPRTELLDGPSALVASPPPIILPLGSCNPNNEQVLVRPPPPPRGINTSSPFSSWSVPFGSLRFCLLRRRQLSVRIPWDVPAYPAPFPRLPPPFKATGSSSSPVPHSCEILPWPRRSSSLFPHARPPSHHFRPFPLALTSFRGLVAGRSTPPFLARPLIPVFDPLPWRFWLSVVLRGMRSFP